MKTVRQTLKIVAVICGISFLVSGCSKELSSRYSGTDVLLSAGAPSFLGTTKADYSGYIEGTGYERIEWALGDVVRICSNKARVSNNAVNGVNYNDYFSDYVVENVVASSGKTHVADKLSNLLGNGLAWQDDKAHLFWGIYPAPGTDGVVDGLAITSYTASQTPSGTVTATLPIPVEQTVTRKENTAVWNANLLKGGYMLTAGNIAPPATGGKANFDFAPAFSSFEFVFGTDTEMQIKGFEMYTTTVGNFNSNKSATALCGTATATLNETTWGFNTVERNSDNSKITVSLSEPINLLPKESTSTEGVKEAHLTVLALPQELSGITIKFITNVGNRTLKLTQNGSWIDFPARQKAYIKGLVVPGSVWMITFDPSVNKWKEIDDTINVIVD